MLRNRRAIISLSHRQGRARQDTRQMPRVSIRCQSALLAGWLVVCGPSLEAQPQVQKQVLVLQSFHSGNIVADNFTTNLHVELDQRAEQPVNFVPVVVGPIGSVGAPERAIVDFIVSSFANGPQPDLIMAVSGPAAVFARKYRSAALPRHAAPVRRSGLAIPARCTAWGERGRRRGQQRFSPTHR